jgi:cell division protein FtsB
MSHLPPPSGPPRDAVPPVAPVTAVPPSSPPPGVLPPDPGAYVPPPPMRVRPWPFLLGGMAIAVIATVGVLASSWDLPRIQYFHDAYVAWSEPIPDDVAAIADATGMSETGELIYRASTPAVEDDDDFNQHCSIEGGAVLGCYYEGNVYVYAVTDERLAGTVEVTAAHEMLHAAYERLSPEERSRIDALVDEAIAAIPDDDPVYEDLALYPAAQLADEWHSRLGTEFADLPAELEEHYAVYFDDRAKVVELNVQANAYFDQLNAQIDALVAEIDALDPVLDARIAAYEAAIADFNADVASFNARADNGSFTSQAQFNNERAALVARGAALDAEYAAIDAEITHYNDLVAQLTALDEDYADLYSALDSSDDQESVSP